MITGDLKSKIDGLWEDFWVGGITNPLTVIEQITYLMYSRMLDTQEQRDEKRKQIAGIDFKPRFTPEQQEFRFSHYSNLGSDEMMEVVRDGVFQHFRQLGQADASKVTLLGNFMKDARLEIVKPSLLTKAVEVIKNLPLDRGDTKGDLYEYLLSKLTTAGINGQFRTPRHIIRTMVEMMEPNPARGETICDPACGSGSLLMKCGRKIVSGHDSRNYALFGQEAIGSTWSLAKMNMFLHGEDNHKIEWGDTIRNPKLLDKNGDLMLFDIVTANPPFSLDKWGHDEAENDKFGRFRRGVPPKTKGDYAFISHMIETLKPGTGRMGVVVPHGVLFRGSSEGKIRQKLIDENLLDAVIGLPEKLFYGTGIPAAILIFKKQKVDDKVLFIDASREFKAGKNQNQLSEENIKKIVKTYRDGDNVEKYAYLASLKEIQDNDYNLNIPRYVDTFEEEEEIDLLVVHAEREELKAELAKLETEMEGYLKELGYGV